MPHKIFVQPRKSYKTESCLNLLNTSENSILLCVDKTIITSMQSSSLSNRILNNFNSFMNYVNGRNKINLIIDEYLRLTVDQRKFIQANKYRFNKIVAYATPAELYSSSDFFNMKLLKSNPQILPLEIKYIKPFINNFDSLYFNLLTDFDVEIIHSPKYLINKDGAMPNDLFNMEFNAMLLK